MNQTFDIQKLEANPFDNEQLNVFLRKAHEIEPETYLAFWLSAGTELTQRELQRLQWEHFTDSKTGLIIRGSLGSSGEAVETPLPDKAASAISSLRRSIGPVFREKVWSWKLRTMMGLSRAADISTFRAYLEVFPCHRTKGRSTPVRNVPPPPPLPPEPKFEPQVTVPAIPEEKPVKQPAKTTKRCIPADEVARMLSMSVRWVKDQVKAGNLKGYRLGNKVMVDAQSLNEFLSERSMRQEVA